MVAAHSEKEDATPTWKRGFGRHPLLAFLDHGPDGTGEPAAALLRPGRAGAGTATDHITVAQLALAQLPKRHRRGRRTLIRTDSAGGAHAFLDWLTRRARCEDRIRTARDTGLRNLPLHTTRQNQIWLEIVQLALDLLAWMPCSP